MPFSQQIQICYILDLFSFYEYHFDESVGVLDYESQLRFHTNDIKRECLFGIYVKQLKALNL